jgi:hypothetical protein
VLHIILQKKRTEEEREIVKSDGTESKELLKISDYISVVNKTYYHTNLSVLNLFR